MKIVWRIAKFKLHMQVGRNKKVISRLLSGFLRNSLKNAKQLLRKEKHKY